MAGDREIAMTHRDADRGADGVLRAFYNVCKHRGHELLASAGTKCQIACPYHGWVYALDGPGAGARGTRRATRRGSCGFSTAASRPRSGRCGYEPGSASSRVDPRQRAPPLASDHPR